MVSRRAVARWASSTWGTSGGHKNGSILGVKSLKVGMLGFGLAAWLQRGIVVRGPVGAGEAVGSGRAGRGVHGLVRVGWGGPRIRTVKRVRGGGSGEKWGCGKWGR